MKMMRCCDAKKEENTREKDRETNEKLKKKRKKQRNATKLTASFTIGFINIGWLCLGMAIYEYIVDMCDRCVVVVAFRS